MSYWIDEAAARDLRRVQRLRREHTCPSCTPDIYAFIESLCPRCGTWLIGVAHDGEGWAFDVCALCRRFMADEAGD